MKMNDLITTSVNNLWRRKARTALTVLGVLIGSSSILLMMSLGIGFESAFNKQMEEFIDIKVIEVYNEMGGAPQGDGDNSAEIKFNEELANDISQIAGVDAVLPLYYAYAQINSGPYEASGQLIGADMALIEEFYQPPQQGRLPAVGAKEVLVGNSIEFYNPNAHDYQPIEVEMLDKSMKFYINGMYDYEGNKKRPQRLKVVGRIADNGMLSYSMILDKALYLQIIEREEKTNSEQERPVKRSERQFDTINVKCQTIDDVAIVNDQLSAMGLNPYSPIEYVQQEKERINMLQMLLGGIGFVALFVAAIGITNTMIMSIYERTREIGIMKVLGAELRDIMSMFLFEAAIIGFIGGVFAIGLSLLGSDLINKFVGSSGVNDMAMGMNYDISIIPFSLILQSLLFSTLIGVLSGLFPAYRATKLSALEAIRNE